MMFLFEKGTIDGPICMPNFDANEVKKKNLDDLF